MLTHLAVEGEELDEVLHTGWDVLELLLWRLPLTS